MDPISTGLAGIALVQKSVDFIKSNINTVNDIRDIAGALDGLSRGKSKYKRNGLAINQLLVSPKRRLTLL